LWALAFLVLIPGVGWTADKPNFIVIFVDDLGYNDLGSYGSPHIETPSIDGMAAEGIRFTDFYAQNVCGPSRAALLTGSYPIRVAEPGNRKNQHTVLHPREVTIAELLKQQGYSTAAIGKWHVAGAGEGLEGPGTGPYRAELMPNAQGFDYFFGTPAHNGTTRDLARWKTELHRNSEVLELDVSMDKITELETEEAIAFVREHDEEPFFLYLAYNMVHVVLGASPEYRGSSRRGLYGDAVGEIDDGVGRLLETLEELGLDEDTLVVFTSDNGPWVEGHLREHGGSAFPLRGYKMTTWEGGARVPGIMRWPGKIPGGQVSSEMASTLDLFPTFAALAGAEVPDDRQIDGVDLSPMLLGRSESSGRDTFFHYAWTYLQAVRQGDWKLVVPRPANPPWTSWYGRMIDAVEETELYNLAVDVGEMNSVAARYPEKVAELTRLYERVRNELGDYDLVGSGARFFDEDPPAPGEHREHQNVSRPPVDVSTKLSTGGTAVRFRYEDAIGHEPGVTRRDPSDVIRVGDTYYVWYTKVTRRNVLYPSGYNGSVWYATSPDGRRWEEQGLVLAPGDDDDWDGHGVFTPNILALEGKYFLYYTAVAKPFNNGWSEAISPTAIGVAVSDSPDGPWRRHGENPVLKAALDEPTAFDSLRVDDASLIVREGEIWMYYKGRSRSHGAKGPTMTQMGLATAVTPTGPFIRHEANPLHPGHEVLVWPQGYGIGSMATAAGPRQLYYAFDGVQFTEQNRLVEPPQAPGVFREDDFQYPVVSDVPRWGIGHARVDGDLHLTRFEFLYGRN